MANLRDLNTRIITLKNMQKVMRAMNMIASIKLRKLVRLQAGSVFFEKSLKSITADISQALKNSEFPLITGFKDIKKVHVIIFTADKGLCGAHNTSVQKNLDIFIKEQKKNNIAVEVTCVGIKGVNFCKRRDYLISRQTEINDKVFNAQAALRIAGEVSRRFNNNEFQEIYIIFNYFLSTIHQETVTVRLIPFTPVKAQENELKREFNPQIEPKPDKFIEFAQTQYLYYRLMSALANSYLSEQAARMTAMENATKNSDDMINHYAALQNRARQATITNDLIEIISGKEALEG